MSLQKDIKTLAKECLGAKERSNATMIVEKLCEPYDTWMNSKAEYANMFAYHFIVFWFCPF